MTKWLLRSIFFVMCSLATAQFSFADSYEITLFVTNPDGTPAEGAIASTLWQNRDSEGNRDSIVALDDFSAKTDAAGIAKLRIDNWKRKRCVMIQSDDGALSAIIKAGIEDHQKKFEVVLESVVKVSGQLVCEELKDIKWTNTVISPGPKRQDFLIQWSSTNGKFQFVAPPGEYTLYMYGSHILRKYKTIRISSDDRDLDLGDINVELDPKQRLIGKPAPVLTVAETRGVAFDAKENNNRFGLDDYRGKWVLLEFWGYW